MQNAKLQSDWSETHESVQPLDMPTISQGFSTEKKKTQKLCSWSDDFYLRV